MIDLQQLGWDQVTTASVFRFSCLNPNASMVLSKNHLDWLLPHSTAKTQLWAPNHWGKNAHSPWVWPGLVLKCLKSHSSWNRFPVWPPLGFHMCQKMDHIHSFTYIFLGWSSKNYIICTSIYQSCLDWERDVWPYHMNPIWLDHGIDSHGTYQSYQSESLDMFIFVGLAKRLASFGARKILPKSLQEWMNNIRKFTT